MLQSSTYCKCAQFSMGGSIVAATSGVFQLL